MLVPGLSITRKIIIQNKLDKIINKEYNTPCRKFIKQINKFNEQLTKNFTNEKMSILNAKLSKNFYLKRSPQHRLKLIMNFDTNISEFERVKKTIYKTFTLNELLILFKNLDYFIKDDKIREIFPKLNKNFFETIYSKDITDKTPMQKIKKKLNLISPLKYNKELNKNNSSYFINKEKINKILLEYNKKMKKEEKKIANKKMKDFEQQKFFQKTMRELRYNINNISKISNSREFSFEHPLVNYYLDKKKKFLKSNIINYKTNVLSLTMKNSNKYKCIINKYKNTLSLIKNNQGNILTNRIKEKQIINIKKKEIDSLSLRFNNDFKNKIYTLRKSESFNNFNIDKIINNYKNKKEKDFNS